MKRALIMEGGAMRGLFTCGVIDVLMENGISFEGAAGISAGAVFGCNFKSHQIGRPRRYNEKYSKDPRYGSIISWLKTGDLFDADFCYRELAYVLDPFDAKTYAEDPMEFYVGCTDAQTGKIEFHLCMKGDEEDMKWMRASASLPVASRPVYIDGRLYLDGGIACSVPYAFMEEKGYDRNLIILTQPKGYRKKKTSLLPAMKVMLKRYPKIYEAMENRHIMYAKQMEEIEEREAQGKVLVLRPEESLGIGRTEKDPKELERVYQEGRKETLRRLDEIRSFLNE